MSDRSQPREEEQELIAELDTVVLVDGLPSLGIEPGTVGTVVDVHASPRAAVEVEVVDGEGRTLFCGPVDPSAVRLLHRAGADESQGVTDDRSDRR